MSKALGAVVFTSTAAMARVVVVCTAGFLLERHGILRASQRKTVAQIVTVCLVPCLIFSSMSFAIQSNRNVEEWAVLPFWAVLHVGFGVGISNLFIWARRKLSAKYDTLPLGGQDEGGEVGGSIVLSPLGSGDDGSGGAGGSGSGSNSNSNPPSRQLLFSMDDAIIIVCVSFPNSGNLPMALGQSVCSVSFDDVFGDADADTCSALVVGYVALYLIIYQPLLWGLAPRFLEAGVATAAITTTRTAAATTAEAAAAMVEAEAEASLSKEGGGGGASQGSAAAAAAASPPPDVAAVAVADAAAGARTAAAKVRGFLSRVPPPIYACLLGLLAGASPPSFLFSESSWLKPAFTDAIVLLGDAAIPMQIINLGSSITAKRVESEQLAMRQSSVIFVLLARLVAVPMLSIGTTQLLLHTGALSRDNPHMLLVLMIESSTPTAMQIMVMCQLWHQRAEGMLGGLFVRSYLLSLVTVTFWTGTVLFLLGTTDGDGDAAAG